MVPAAHLQNDKVKDQLAWLILRNDGHPILLGEDHVGAACTSSEFAFGGTCRRQFDESGRRRV